MPSISSASGSAGYRSRAAGVGLVAVDQRVADHEPDADARHLLGELGRDVAVRVGDDEHLRVAVVEDVRGFVGGEVVVDGRVEEPGALRGPAELEVLGPVLHQDRDVVAEAQPRVPEQLRELVGAVVQLPVRDRVAGAGHDVRDLVGPFTCMEPRPHDLPPAVRVRQKEVMTLRMTSPFSIAVKASFTSSSLIVRDTMLPVSSRPVSMRSMKRWKSRRT